MHTQCGRLQGGRVGRRRLFLLITIAGHLAALIPGVDVALLKRELIRIVRCEHEMNRLIAILKTRNFPGELEDVFFQTVFYDLNKFAAAVGAMVPQNVLQAGPQNAPQVGPQDAPQVEPQNALQLPVPGALGQIVQAYLDADNN